MKVSTVTPSYNQVNSVRTTRSKSSIVLAHQGIGCRRNTGGNYAHAVVRRRSSRNDNAAFFAVKVGMVSVLPALECNWGVSAEMRKTVYSWITF